MAPAAMSFGLGEFYALGCAFAWAVAVILFRRAGEHLPATALNLVKNSFVLPLFMLTILIVEGTTLPQMPGWHWVLILVSGVVGIAAGDTLYLRALNVLGAGRMAAVQTLYSPFVIVLSLAFLGEHLSLGQLGGVALVLGGILLVAYSRGGVALDRRQRLVALGWGGLSVFLMALGVVMVKPVLEQHSFVWVVALRIVGGLLGLLLIVAATRRFRALRAAYAGVHNWPLILLAGLVGSYLSMMLWLAGYKYTEASIAAVLNEFAAVFILLLAMLLLREPVSRRQWLGTALAVAGVVLVVLR